MRSAAPGKVDFPTLGDILDAWIEQHCRVPQGFTRGTPFKLAEWQWWCVANHYRVREDAVWNPDRPLLSQAFVYRRSQIVAPQKTGKGPLAAAITAAEAVGPTVFAGFAEGGEVYRCEDHGCPCGWEWEYQAGEAMGTRHPSPLIQLLATSEDQVANTYAPLKTMIALGPLKETLAVRENFIRILGQGDDPDLDKIEAVTASANSRVGNPISFAVQDETGLYTSSNKMRSVAEAQRRGLAGMSGRMIETTNSWDPTESSVAQTTYESPERDIFRFYQNPDLNPDLVDSKGNRLSYQRKEHRRRIHAAVYAGSPWVDLDAIEAEAAELVHTDPAQAERFFGNRLVYGQGSWLETGAWEAARGRRPLAA